MSSTEAEAIHGSDMAKNAIPAAAGPTMPDEWFGQTGSYPETGLLAESELGHSFLCRVTNRYEASSANRLIRDAGFPLPEELRLEGFLYQM